MVSEQQHIAQYKSRNQSLINKTKTLDYNERHRAYALKPWIVARLLFAVSGPCNKIVFGNAKTLFICGTSSFLFMLN